MGKKLQKYLDEAEKTEQQIAELEERLRTIRAAQKKEEDVNGDRDTEAFTEIIKDNGSLSCMCFYDISKFSYYLYIIFIVL